MSYLIGDPVRVATRDRYNGRRGRYTGSHLGELGVRFRPWPPESEDPKTRVQPDAWFRPAEVSPVARDR